MKRLIVGFCFAALAVSAADTKREVFPTRLNESFVLDMQEPIVRVSTSNPQIADYVVASSREIIVHAKGLGTATIILWLNSGTRKFYEVRVHPDVEALREMFLATFPGEGIEMTAEKDTISLRGRVSSAAVSERAAQMLASSAKTIVNHLEVAPPRPEIQILLKVRFAELNRNAVQSLGVNIFSTGAAGTIGRTTTGQFGGPGINELRGDAGGVSTNWSIGDMLNVFAFRPDINLGVAIRALKENGMLQILAEPNLVTSNGKEASFLVGGEFPVPIVQGGANAGAITIQWKEFGIRLTFLPEIMPSGTLRMKVKPEVSTIDMNNAVRVQGQMVPALSTRRIDSTIELGPGQSFVIGGLIDDRTVETLQGIPGLSSIPILGYLFKSKYENKNKTELLVVVTPELVEPINPSDPALLLNPPKRLLDPMLFPQIPATIKGSGKK